MLKDDEPQFEQSGETGPMHEDSVAKTEAMASIDDLPTNPVRDSMLSKMSDLADDDDPTEFLRSSDSSRDPSPDSSYDPTEELRSDNLRQIAVASGFDMETIESSERASLKRRGAPAGPRVDDSDVVTIETDEQQALQRRRSQPPQTRPAVVLEPPTAPLPDLDPPTEQLPAANLLPPGRPELRPPTRNKSAPFWKRESFWKAGQSTQAAEVLSVPLSDAERDARQAQAMKIALAGGFAGAVIALAIAMSTWMAPSTVILLAVALAIPVALTTAWLCRPADLNQLDPDDLKLLAKPIAAGVALLLLFTLPWQLGFVRSMLRPFTGNSAAMSLLILQDRSETVAIDECVRIAPNPERVKSLAAGLPGRAKVTKECFSRVTDQPQAAARDILTQWRPLMIAPTVQPELACGIAQSSAALPLPKWELRSTFVDCVVEGGAEAQKCCGEALLSIGQPESPPPADYVPDEPAAGSWLKFTQTKLSPRQQKIRAAVGLDSRLAEDAAIDFACRATTSGANMGPHFIDSLGSRCGVSRGTPTDAAYWKKVCASTRQRHAAQKDRTKGRALCDAAKAGGALLGAQPGEDSPEQ